VAKSSNSHKFTISAGELSQGLGLSLERLYEIVEFFDQDSKDEWELKEDEHFIWLIKNSRTRTFSEFGAFAIANYLDKNHPWSPWDKFKEFIFGHKAKLRKAFIREKILNNRSSFLIHNSRGFLSKRDSVNIFVTSHARFNKAFTDIQTSEMPLQVGYDFDDIEGTRYYSTPGLFRISQLLGTELKSKDRREWCAEVTIHGPKIIKILLDEQLAIEKRINAAKAVARGRDKSRCQVTNQGTKPAKPINLAVHHIFCRNYYPQLAASPENLITITETIHRDFHAWNGGFQACCTADKLIEFISIHYPEADAMSVRLHQINKIYGHITPSSTKKLVEAK
jgi:hypothetical protein